MLRASQRPGIQVMQQKGHLATVCCSNPMPMPMRAYEAQESCPNMNETIEVSIHPEVSPRLNVIIKHKNDDFPDLGGSVMMITKDLAIKKNLEILHNVKMPTFAAINGVELQIDGTTIIEIENLSNGIKKTTVTIVSPDVSNDILVGYPQLKELHVIEEKFPLSTYCSISNDNPNDFEKISNCHLQ